VNSNLDVELDWDEANVRHLARHKITREEVEEFFANDPTFVDYEIVNGEDRWTALCATNELRVLFVVFTMRGERIRPVSGWDADRLTEEDYFRSRGW